MASRIATLIRCGDTPRLVVPTLRSVERQSSGCPSIVLLSDRSTPAAARDWLSALASRSSATYVHSETTAPGALRNAGVRAVNAEWIQFVEAGDYLEPSFHELSAAFLDGNPSAPFVTTATLTRGPGAERSTYQPRAASLSALLADPDAAHNASVFRRTHWLSAGGFSEDLPLLEDYDFWLKLAAAGEGGVIPEALLVRTRRRRDSARPGPDADRRSATLEAIVGRHADAPGTDPADVLFRAEERIRLLASAYHAALERRDRTVEEIKALSERTTALVATAPAEGLDLGDLRRVTPVSREWGYDRGGPIDRRYIEPFLERHASDIAGAVLEVQEPDYSRRFGAGRVTRSDVVDLDTANPRATLVSDLRAAANIPSDTYDCVILTQTIHVIDDMPAVAAEVARILKPGGVLLATLPAASRVCVEYGEDGDFWRVTAAGARAVFARAFPHDHLEIESLGNVLVNAAFMFGLGAGELTPDEYGFSDPYYPALITVRARKPRPPAVAGILLYHRVADSTGSDVHRLSVSPSEFERQMTVLRDRFIPMPLGELAALVRSGSVPDGAVAITFDDGYLDNLETASPILQRLGIPATFFCTTEAMDDPAYEYWWDVLEHALLVALATPAELALEWHGERRTWPTRTLAERASAHDAVYQLLAPAPAAERQAAIDTLRQWSGDGPRPPAVRRITTVELRDLASRPGHDIGAHSARHLMLPEQDPDTQREEVLSSQRDLAVALGRPIDLFAYPFGSWNQSARDAVRAAGFSTAVACGDRALDGTDDPLALPRLDPASRGAESFADWLRRRVRSRAISAS